jgi:flagellin
MQQLSTGLRINGAKDDAAGLAIASKMTSQIKGLDQAVRNSNDAISMLQTADGAMIAVSDMLQRMRELSVQAASDTNVSSDRSALNSEFSQLKGEIGRIAKSTQWNGMNILDGTANGNTGSFNFQIGASAGQTINKTISSMGLGTSTTATSTISTASYVSTVAQVATQTLTAGGTFTAGDVITSNVNGNQWQYTVKATDITVGNTPAQNLTAIAASMQADPAATAFGTANGLTIGLSSTTGITYTAAVGAAPIAGTASAQVATGGLLAQVNDLDVSSQSHASFAIKGMDTAIATVNSQRSDLGATINRLTYTADNLANVSQNAQASRSRIQDTDYAKTSTELARTQIIAQAATAMLAQANQSQQSVLSLLK